MPWGIRIAVNTIPATTSLRSHDRSYARNVATPGTALVRPLTATGLSAAAGWPRPRASFGARYSPWSVGREPAASLQPGDRRGLPGGQGKDNMSRLRQIGYLGGAALMA